MSNYLRSDNNNNSNNNNDDNNINNNNNNNKDLFGSYIFTMAFRAIEKHYNRLRSLHEYSNEISESKPSSFASGLPTFKKTKNVL